MKNVEALSFDLDGTLLDGSPWREVIMRTCREIAAALPDLEAERLVEANGDVWESYWPDVEDQWILGSLGGRAVTTEAWHRTLLACGSDEESSTLFAVETYLRNRRDALRLFDDVLPLFNALKPRIPIALVTNGASDTQREVLHVLGIEHKFDAVIISSEVGIAKPDPAIFGLVVDKLRTRPDQAWHIGDNLRVDVAGAKNAGLIAVWMNRQGARREPGDPEPDYELRSLLELPTLLSTQPFGDTARGTSGTMRSMVDWRSDRIGSALRGENPTVLSRMPAAFAVIGDVQWLPGYCVLLSDDPSATRLSDLPPDQRSAYLDSMARLAAAVEDACAAADPAFRRVNVEILGNADDFLHAHIWPRYGWEPDDLVWRPVWLYPPEKWRDPSSALGPQHDALRAAITANLKRA